MSFVAATLIAGYAQGYIDLPKIEVTYTPTRQSA
jgi:hypothetical protein